MYHFIIYLTNVNFQIRFSFFLNLRFFEIARKRGFTPNAQYKAQKDYTKPRQTTEQPEKTIQNPEI